MARELLLALDLGTTNARALVLEPDGTLRGRAVRPLRARFPAPGRVEQDPEEWVTTSIEVLRAALHAAGIHARAVAGLGIATQRATAVAWDAKTGRALAPALGWQDRRPLEVADWLAERGLPLGTQPAAAKFVWWQRCDPHIAEMRRRGRLRLGTPDAWLGMRLSGCAVTDPGQASCTALYDPAARDWSAVLLERLELERSALPRIVATAESAGETHAGLLGAAVPVVARAGDQQAAAFAQGVHTRGAAKLTLGTSAMLDVHVGEAPCAPPTGCVPLALWRLPDGSEAWCLEGHVATAGATVEWLRMLGLLRAVDEVDAVAREAATSDGVVFVPALEGLATPFSDPRAAGLIGGLTRGSGRAQLVRAALEGIAQRCADVWDVLRPDCAGVPVDGGLARSEVLLQLLADLLGRPVEPAAELETTALGAGWLAGLASGVIGDPASCGARRGAARRVEPRLGDAERVARRAEWRRRVETRVLTRS